MPDKEKKISRKAFLKYGGMLFALPLVFTSSISCEKILTSMDAETVLPDTDIAKAILNQPRCTAVAQNSKLLKSSGEEMVTIPKEAVKTMRFKKTTKSVVVRIHKGSQITKLKSVEVELVQDNGKDVVVKGLCPGDSILLNPARAIKELAVVNKMALRKAFSPF